MDVALLVMVVGVVFLVVLVLGRGEIAKGSNNRVANGAALLVVAAMVGVLAVEMLVRLDIW